MGAHRQQILCTPSAILVSSNLDFVFGNMRDFDLFLLVKKRHFGLFLLVKSCDFDLFFIMDFEGKREIDVSVRHLKHEI